MIPTIFTIMLTVVALTASTAYSDHERFGVGEMRNVDPSNDTIVSTSGTCIPSHDRETLVCYFTAFYLAKSFTDAKLKKQYDDAVQELKNDPKAHIEGLKKMCSDRKMMQAPDPIRLKYSAWLKAFVISSKSFCENPSADSALAFTRTMTDVEAKKCRVLVNDWRSTLVRQTDRWVENVGPSGLCGAITVFTLVPHDINKMREPTGPLLWTLHEKTVTTHKPDDKVCTKGLFMVEEGSSTYSWDAPQKSMDCGDFDFTSVLGGMSDPRGPKGK